MSNTISPIPEHHGNDSAVTLKETGNSGRSEPFQFVGEYGLLVRLGVGGMGEVWAARDARSKKNRIIALKTTRQTGSEAAKVLRDEARIASLINHPNVCSLHELSQADGVQFLVIDYCDGANLHDLLQVLPEHKLTIALACHIVSEVAAGLQAAHEVVGEAGEALGVVHRDVSPQNVLISTQGMVTITDFGVAKAMGQAHKATETGEMKGKLSYMAPEQITGNNIDARADVFALGCVLYQVTLGRRPFHGADALATLYQLLEQELVAPTTLQPDFPPELEAIIKKALAKNPDDRFSSAAEMQRALQTHLVHSRERVSSSEVAGALMEHLGAVISTRKEELKRRNTLLSTSTRENQKKSQIAQTQPRATTPVGQELSNTALSVNQKASRRRSKRTRLAVLALVSSTAVLGVLGFKELGFMGEDKPQVMPAVQPTRQAPELSPPDTDLVSLEVTTAPENARIIWDGKIVGSGTFTQEFSRSSDGHLLQVQAPGYQSESRAVVLDHPQSIAVALSRAPEAPTSSADPPPIASKAKPIPKAPRYPKVNRLPKKLPRTLDSNNPFAEQ